MARGHRITDWNPEDAARAPGNSNVARDHVAFSVWTVWLSDVVATILTWMRYVRRPAPALIATESVPKPEPARV